MTLMFAVATALLGWWLCVVVLTLRAGRGTDTRDASRTPGMSDHTGAGPVS